MRKMLSIWMLTAMLFVFAACQATPEEPIVIKKDTERLVEKAGSKDGGTKLPDLGIPQGRYTFDTNVANGKLRIHVDADIAAPAVSVMPVVQVSMGLFSQEQVTGIFHYLFPNEKPKYDFGQVETKADVEQEILRLKKQLADGDYKISEDELKARIAQVEAAYQNAPDSAPEGGISDGTLARYELEPNNTARTLQVSNSEYALWISTHTGIEGINGSQLPSLSYRCQDSDRSYSTRNMLRMDGTNLPQAAAQSLPLPYDEAKALCDGFFAAAGFPNGAFRIGDSFVIDDTGADEKPGSKYAYRFIYTRVVDNIPLFFDRTGTLANRDDGFALPWNYEYIEFVIDSKGIVSINWRFPINIGKTIESASALKSFEEIMDIFEVMMKTSYEGIVLTVFSGEAELDISVERIELCLLRIRAYGNAQTDGLLIPAWIFSGRNKGTDKNGAVKYLQDASALAGYDIMSPNTIAGENNASVSTFELAPSARKDDTVNLLAINAIDGSIIDLSKGY